MCIRDRPLSRQGDRAEHHGAALCQLALRAELEQPLHRSHTCLLYTSDAADERSSVDLGGRRIIKKKNNRRTVDGIAMNKIHRTIHD